MKTIIVGSGIGGLATACLLAKAGYEVEVFEKNECLGGRASIFEANGYRFDMGPSWYLMPDIFEHFFTLMGKKVENYLDLIKLSPSYRIFFRGQKRQQDFFSDLSKDLPIVERIEVGAAERLKEYLEVSAYQYEIATKFFMYKNYDSWRDLFTWQTMKLGRKLAVFTSMHNYVKSYFKTDELQKIMEYQLVFLGSSPYNTPALYNIMNHIDFNMGVFYPQGGIYEIINALVSIGNELGVKYHTSTAVEKIVVNESEATGVLVKGAIHKADIIISNADMVHTEQALLEPQYQSFKPTYWEKRVMSPSALVMYLGVKGKIPQLVHHNLIFSADWKTNFTEIFEDKVWPQDPSLYVCVPSKTDPTVAPAENENLFVLVPIAPGLQYNEAELQKYADRILHILAQEWQIPDLVSRIEFQKLFCVADFTERYNSFQGSALGLAHTLRQTACFRPNNKSRKVRNLYYVGAGTNPGIGMPICLISAELVYKRIMGITSAEPLPT